MNTLIEELNELPELADRLKRDDLTVIVSVSGGVDSIASLLWCIEKFPKARLIAHHQAIPMDWISTIPYLRDVCNQLNVDLHISQAVYVKHLRTFKNGRLPEKQLKMNLVRIGEDRDEPYDRHSAAYLLNELPSNVVAGVLDLAEHRNAPPTSKIRYCTSYSKRDCFNKWVRENRDWIGPTAVNVIGYRRLESSSRAKQPVGRERDAVKLISSGWKMFDFHPILNWAKADCFAMLKRYGIDPHIAYEAQGLDLSEEISEGGPRMSCVGCFYCPAKHTLNAVQYSPNIPRQETEHVRAVMKRILAFQRESGMTWQQSGEYGLNTIAKMIGEPLFQKEAGIPQSISLKI